MNTLENEFKDKVDFLFSEIDRTGSLFFLFLYFLNAFIGLLFCFVF